MPALHFKEINGRLDACLETPRTPDILGLSQYFGNAPGRHPVGFLTLPEQGVEYLWNMKNGILKSSLVVFATLLCTRDLPRGSEAAGPVVVELFTSEGCSSCPPAESTMMNIGEELGASVLELEFHVDYWNRLGWTDSYSKAAYSQRQYAYSRWLGERSVFTPQAIINGRFSVVGSDRSSLLSSIRQEQQQHHPAPLPLRAKTKTAGGVWFRVEVPPQANDQLVLLWLQNQARTKVKAGENSGLTLEHHHVVREMQIENAVSGTLEREMKFPDGLNPGNCRLAVLLQDRQSGRINAAAVTKIEE